MCVYAFVFQRMQQSKTPSCKSDSHDWSTQNDLNTIQLQEEPFTFPNFFSKVGGSCFSLRRAFTSLCAALSVTCLYGSCSTFLLSHLLHLLVINPNGGNDWERNGGTKRPPHSTTSKVLPRFLSTISCLDFGCCRTFFLLLLLLLCHFLCKIQLLRNRSKDPTRSMQKYKATSFTRSLSNLNRFTPVSRTCLLGFLLPESGLDLRRSFFLLFFESL